MQGADRKGPTAVLKSAAKMEEMKYDMCGGAAVLGAMRAIAQLKPAVRVTALIPAVENMPGAKAQRPGDIVTVKIERADAYDLWGTAA